MNEPRRSKRRVCKPQDYLTVALSSQEQKDIKKALKASLEKPSLEITSSLAHTQPSLHATTTSPLPISPQHSLISLINHKSRFRDADGCLPGPSSRSPIYSQGKFLPSYSMSPVTSQSLSSSNTASLSSRKKISLPLTSKTESFPSHLQLSTSSPVSPLVPDAPSTIASSLKLSSSSMVSNMPFRALSCPRCLNFFKTESIWQRHVDCPTRGCLLRQAAFKKLASASSSAGVFTNVPNRTNTSVDNSHVMTLAQEFNKQLGLLRATTRVIKRIPKGARLTVADELTKIVNKCSKENSVDSWHKLLGFAYSVFRLPQSNAAEKKLSLATVIKRNLANTDSDSYAQITNDVKQKQHKPMLARVVEGKLADGDVRGAIRILCSDDILAPRNIKTLTALQDKHPKARSFDSTPFQAPTLQITSVTAKEVMQSVHSFPSGSSGGQDGLRPQHLKDLLAETNGESSNLLAKALASLADIMLAGKVPKEICPILYGASLTALNKKDGGIRPIAVGCTLRRLVAKIGCQRSQIESGNILRPKQFGFGTKGGAEAIIHAVRRYVNQESKSTLVLLKLDFKNAFNAITRDNMLEQVRSKLPNLYPFMSQCYQDATILSYGKETILSECGCQQGDPLGPLFFCLAIQPLVSSLQSPLNTWYMDDGTLGGSIDQVMEDVKLIQLAAFNLGLELNTNKCEIFLLNHNKQEENKSLSRLHHCLPGARVAQQDEWRLLGAPLTNEAIPGVLHEKNKSS